MSEFQSKGMYYEAQAGVLGSVLLDPGAWAGEMLHRTKPEDYTGEWRSIYSAIQALFLAGTPIDPTIVLDKLGKAYGEILADLMQNTPTPANCSEYIRITLEQSRLTKIQSLGLALAGEPALEGAQNIIAQINRILGERSTVRVVSMAEGLLDFYDRQQKKADIIPWGTDSLDDNLLAQPGDMIVLGGYPSAGKTAFSLQLAWEQAKHYRVGYFSLETKPEKVIDRLVATVCGVDFGHIKRHKLSEHEWAECEIKSAVMRDRKLDVIQAGGLSVTDIQAISLSKRHEIIYIDYLQLVSPEDRRRSDFEQVTQISKDLHTMATTTGITVVPLSQLSRPSQNGEGEKAPGLHSLRQSGQIEQDADGVMLLYKEEPKARKSRRALKIAKNKEGESGLVLMLDFDGARQRFRPSMAGPLVEKTKKEPEHKQMGFQDITNLSAAADCPF